MEKKYDHKQVESNKYEQWLQQKLFQAGDLKKPPFCIVIPPPNVTGRLHLGHAWDTTIQDVIIRYKRMKGYDALWIPGMDHAGIATQAKVDERLRSQGTNPRGMNRDEWTKIAWSWKEEYAKIIRSQWGKLGLSLDYSREKFTLDPDLNNAVNEVFVTLYNKGYIYRGERIIHYDPVAMTALSNIEVIYKEEEAILYYLKYQLADSNQYFTIATTRPETIFGDTAIAVNPNDKRYNQMENKMVIIPTLDKKIPIILDEHADMEFGSGVVKITPAHDQNDFEVGNRHNLDRVICLNPNGTMNNAAGKYENMDRFQCREKLVNELKEKGLLLREEKITHSIGYSERSNAIIEPYLSKQWFVKVDELAKHTIENQKNAKTKVNFFPERFENVFLNWMTNIQDWCISRQLWWGHRIPAWYKDDEIHVGKEPPVGEGWVQDEDVLDTWFSSALWPFATLGWPQRLNRRYFPNNVLVTGYDIIFFWVSRMIFQSLEFNNERPFQDVLIHGLIRDKDGRKMSKSLGNGVDPMDVIDQYGADALRFFLMSNSSPGQDLRYDEDKVKAAWNFNNKIWNATRFVLLNTKDFPSPKHTFKRLSLYDKWILARLNETILETQKAIENFEFNIVCNTIYSFVWNDYCDWYIELSKFNLESPTTKSVLIYVLTEIVKLLHPFMPFVTEEIYQKFNNDQTSIMISNYPQYNKKLRYKDEINKVEKIKEIITTIRNVKQENKISNEYYLINQLNREELYLITDHQIEIGKILKTSFVKEKPANMQEIIITFAYGKIILCYNSTTNNNIDKEMLQKEKETLIESINKRTNLLANENFTKKAPPNLVDSEKQKLNEETEKLKLIEEQLK
ncbi:MAG: valine--tRNA ligase [Bacilli bacterium]|nr:valine--tRNA ligase [Bacilli bacterium]